MQEVRLVVSEDDWTSGRPESGHGCRCSHCALAQCARRTFETSAVWVAVLPNEIRVYDGPHTGVYRPATQADQDEFTDVTTASDRGDEYPTLTPILVVTRVSLHLPTDSPDYKGGDA